MRDRKQRNDTGAHRSATDPIVFDHYDWDGSDAPSIAVSEAVAAVTNRSVTALPPLQHDVDADALDRLVRSGGDRARITFEYADVTVAVAGDGRIEITTDAR